MESTKNFNINQSDVKGPHFNINRPWLSLDDWQKDYINSQPNQDCFLLCGRQVGKTTAMSIKAVELCINNFKQGEFVLICSITEKQGYHMLAKALSYAMEKYPTFIPKGKDKPTMHRIQFKNGTGIHCYAAGETGEGLRGYTIKKLMIDEGSRMKDEFFIAVSPMLSVVKGSMDIASTPCGKTGFFYKCSLDEKFKKFYISGEDCPRHTAEFLEKEKERMTRLAYAQEYLAIFTDELRRIFNDELIYNICKLKRRSEGISEKVYMGVDIGGFGKDETAIAILESIDKTIFQREQVIEKRKMTTEVTRRILELNTIYNTKKIGVDDGGIGFGVFSELMENNKTKRKTIALNNASREKDSIGETSKKLLKEEMYLNLLSLMENNKIQLLDDDEVKASLSSIQWDEEKQKIFGSYSHITESLIRAAWIAEKEKGLKLFMA